jgi:glutathione S-transferase
MQSQIVRQCKFGPASRCCGAYSRGERHPGAPDEHTDAVRHELSGNSYKVRLFLSLLGLPFDARRVDLFNGEGQQPAYLTISALGQVPALVDAGEALRDSQAILFYLARTRGGGRWLADDPLGQARTIA